MNCGNGRLSLRIYDCFLYAVLLSEGKNNAVLVGALVEVVECFGQVRTLAEAYNVVLVLLAVCLLYTSRCV